jgi:hypothetical protein
VFVLKLHCWLQAMAFMIVMLLALVHGAGAQGRLEAKYRVTVGGVPFGTGTWSVDVGENTFTAAVSGTTTGLLRLFATGRGASAVRGSVAAGQPIASSYSSSITTERKYDEIRMVMNSGNVKDFVAEPPTSPDPERVPLTEAHRRNVQDPMTASLLRVPGNGDTFVPQACNRKVAVFDGRMRYDVQLSYKRLERVKSERGYQGTVVVCGVNFAPVAGHVPSRPIIRYIMAQRNTEIWLAPIAGTRLMVPYRASIPTPLGLGVLEATSFLSTPQSAAAARSTPASAFSQQ